MTTTDKWSTGAWQASLPIYEAILHLPFITQLADGTLPAETFRRYIEQDNLYITQYSRVLSHIASRLENIDDMDAFLKFAGDGVEMEKSLHAMFVSGEPVEMSPTCLFYTSLQKAQAYEEVAVEAAAVLPCFWIYLAVGKHLLSVAKLDGNPYADWIRAYSDPAFDLATERAIAICDRLAEATTPAVRRKMTGIYLQCSRMEWRFWHTAHTPQPWEI